MPRSIKTECHSLAVDCAQCKYFRGPAQWPDLGRVSSCQFHGVSLAIQIEADGYREWTWFCKEFKEDAKKTQPPADRFELLRPQLAAGVIYSLHGKNCYLIEHRATDLEQAKPRKGKPRPD